ncbi:MAG: chorismate synthase [Chloroflexi bacterium]|nr:chorismate synthase [Chloroflexota bacterium]
MLRFLTAGESHGKGLVAVIEGLPAGVPLRADEINVQLARRQGGYGRGGRMKIENDRVEFIAGVRGGLTLGSPIALSVPNLDWVNWTTRMDAETLGPDVVKVTRLRPGHADMPGVIKYAHDDVRNVLERASARETTMRVAVGAVCREFLAQFGVEIHGHVTAIGDVETPIRVDQVPIDWDRVEESPVRCADPEVETTMIAAIDAARREGDTLGGIVEVVAYGLPIGLGSHVQWDRKLDGKLAQAVLSINAFKGVEIGDGFGGARRRGSQVHDVIEYGEGGWSHRTNNSGGTAGGMTTGAPLVVRGALKPIATLARPLPSVDFVTKEAVPAHYERSDVCVAPAAAVIVEAMVAIVLAEAFVEKFGGDSLGEMKRNFESYVATYAPGSHYWKLEAGDV